MLVNFQTYRIIKKMKKYFIKLNEDVFGPYEEKTLSSMFKNKQINSDTLVKRLGSSDFLVLSHFIKTSAPARKVKLQPLPANAITSVDAQEFPYQVNTNATVSTLYTARRGVEEAMLSVKDSFSSVKYYKLIFIPFLIMIGFFAFKTMYIKNAFHATKPNFVKYTSFKKLSDSLEKSYNNQEHVWKFLLSNNLKHSWIASSLPGTHIAHISFKSIPNKVLSHKLIEAETQVKLFNNSQEIKEWTFNKSEKFAPGLYTATVTLLDRELSIFDKIFLPKFNAKNIHETKILIGSPSKKAFIKDLKRFYKKTVKANFTEIQDIEMKYKTLNKIATQINTYIDKLDFSKASQQKKIKDKFVKKYHDEFGSFFTAFVVENKQIYKKKRLPENRAKASPFTKHYSKLTNIAEKIGQISVDTIDKFDSKSLNKDSFSKLKTQYEKVMKHTDKQLKSLKKIQNL